jgi:MFS family permease
MAPAALSLLTVTFTEPRERARAFGVYGAISGGGAAIGLVLGGALTQYASWRWTLLINVPFAIGAALAARRFIRESRDTADHGYDVPGAVTATAGLFLLVYGFTTAATDGWSATRTLVILALAAAALFSFVVVELRAAQPLLPMRVVIDRNRGGAYLASLLVGCAMLGTFLFLTYFFQATQGYSAMRTGFAFLPFSGGIIVGAGLASRLLPRVGPRNLMLGGLLLAALGLAWFTQLGVHSAYVEHVLSAELLVSLGMGMTFVPMSSTSLVGVAPGDAGVASALVNTTQQIGSSLGTAVLNTVAASATAGYLVAHGHTAAVAKLAAVHGYTTAFTVSAALLAAAALATATLIRARGEQTPGSLVDPASAPGSEFAMELADLV